MSCLDEDVITDLIAGRWRADAEAIEAHLEACPGCVQLLGAAGAAYLTTPAAPRARVPLAPGTVLNDTYQVVRLIGRGGMGEVYEVRHVRLAGRYAIKVLRAEVSEDSELLSRFRREAEITSSLRHPSIVQVIDFDRTADGCMYLAMEFLEGHDLAAVLAREGRLELTRVIRFVVQIAGALTAAHRRGIVHRDLKPENVFVLADQAEGERIKLMDFGLSKWATNASPLSLSLRLSRDQALIGTPRYMAPEQALGRNDRVTAATDQFALAALTYEMLAGVPAFADKVLAELLHSIVHREPTNLRQYCRALPPGVIRTVHRGLAKTPDARFPTVEDFAAAMGGGPAVEVRSRRALGLTLAAVIAIGGLAAATERLRPPAGEPPPATRPTSAPASASMLPESARVPDAQAPPSVVEASAPATRVPAIAPEAQRPRRKRRPPPADADPNKMPDAGTLTRRHPLDLIESP